MSADVIDRVERTGSVERHDVTIGRADIWFYVDHDKKLVNISSIRVPQRARRSGDGTRALDYALRIADELHYETELGASPLDKKTSLGRLVRWYQKHGFVMTGQSINPLGHPKMVRAARDPERRGPYLQWRKQRERRNQLVYAARDYLIVFDRGHFRVAYRPRALRGTGRVHMVGSFSTLREAKNAAECFASIRRRGGSLAEARRAVTSTERAGRAFRTSRARDPERRYTVYVADVPGGLYVGSTAKKLPRREKQHRRGLGGHRRPLHRARAVADFPTREEAERAEAAYAAKLRRQGHHVISH